MHTHIWVASSAPLTYIQTFHDSANLPIYCKVDFSNQIYTIKNPRSLAIAHWSGLFNIVQKIRTGNFRFCKLLWVQIIANIRLLNNSHHFDTFDYIYWEIICLELCQNWVKTPYMTILFSEQFQKKIWICTCGKRWTQIHVFLIGKGLSDMQNHNFEQHHVAQGVLTMKCLIFLYFIR